MNDKGDSLQPPPGTPPPIQPYYSEPPGSEPTLGQKLKKFFGPVGVVLVIIAKFFAKLKFILIPVFKFLPFLVKTGGTMLVAFGGYTLFYGWRFALGFVLLIFVHECGHLIVARFFGLQVGAPVFIPFMGAFIALKEAPKDAWMEAWVGIGGPLLGTVGGVVCLGLFVLTGNPLFCVLGATAFALNLFNLAPIGYLDGGRVVTALSPWMWLIGAVVMVGLLLLLHPINALKDLSASAQGDGTHHQNRAAAMGGFLIVVQFIVIGMLLFGSIPRLISLFREKTDEERRYYEVTPGRRVIMAGMYFGLIAFLLFGMMFAQVVVNQ
jgi:Zn-dependent protease